MSEMPSMAEITKLLEESPTPWTVERFDSDKKFDTGSNRQMLFGECAMIRDSKGIVVMEWIHPPALADLIVSCVNPQVEMLQRAWEAHRKKGKQD